ncbi:Uncharacterised protein [Mycobacteroides abscessus subsp. abscessus]|nr:Uncharacterised protein [Mycobacteroides abscessus subsp. abscessus]
MNLDFRGNPAAGFNDKGISYDNSSHSRFLEAEKIVLKPVNIFVMGKDIGRHVNFCTIALRELYAFLHFLKCKIAGI